MSAVLIVALATVIYIVANNRALRQVGARYPSTSSIQPSSNGLAQTFAIESHIDAKY